VAIATADAMIAAMPGQLLQVLKIAPTLQAAGQWYSPWLLAGIPGAGTAPSAGVGGVALTGTDAGAIGPFTNPASGLTYLDRSGVLTTITGTLYLYDRLWHNSGLSTTSLTAQTVTSATLPSRCPVVTDPTGETFDTLGNGVEAWFDVYVVMGAGATAPSISYTNEANTASRTGTAQGFVTTAAVGRCFPFSRAASDRGVRSIQTYTNGATMTSGTFGLVLRRRIASLACPIANLMWVYDWAASSLPAIPDSSHLELIWVPTTTTAPTITGDINLIQG
jgi:hypothetical protein